MYNSTRFSREKCHVECFGQFWEENYEKEARERANCVKLGLYYIYRKGKNSIRHAFTSLIISPILIYYP